MSFDADFERDILIAASNSFAFRRNVRRAIGYEDPWSTDANRLIWDVVDQLGEHDTLTPKIMAKAIKREKDDDTAESASRVAKKIFKGKATAPEYALEELRRWTRSNAIKRTLSEVVSDLRAGDVEEAETRLARLTRDSGRIVEDEYGDWWSGFPDRMATRLEEKENPDKRPRIKTYLHRLDEILDGGPTLGQFGIILAHTNVGKSMLGLQFSYGGAAQGIPTVYISTEMSKMLVDTRLDSRFFDKPTADFAAHKFSKKDLEKFEEKRTRMKARLEHNLLTVSTPINTLTASMIDGYIDEVEHLSGNKCGLVVVDSGDHMLPEYPIPEKRLQQMAVYWDLKKLADVRNVMVWTTTHASGDRKALLTEFDTAESKDKAKIASVILSLNQTQKERAEDKLRLYVAKNRTGTKGAIIDLLANYGKSLFEEAPFED